MCGKSPTKRAALVVSALLCGACVRATESAEHLAAHQSITTAEEIGAYIEAVPSAAELAESLRQHRQHTTAVAAAQWDSELQKLLDPQRQRRRLQYNSDLAYWDSSTGGTGLSDPSTQGYGTEDPGPLPPGSAALQ
eukprot:COSAG02_NODE_20176_length_845_cov_0.990617_1_plen_135_part_10